MKRSSCADTAMADVSGLDGLRDGVYPVGRQEVAASGTSAHLEYEIKHFQRRRRHNL